MKKAIAAGLFIITVLLAGCAAEDTQADGPSYIEQGLEELITEDYQKAQAYFETALEEKPENTKADALNRQTGLYMEAVSLLDEGKLEEAETKVGEVQNIEEGSEGLRRKADDLIDQIESLRAEAEVAEEQNTAEIEEAEEAEPVEEVAVEAVENEEALDSSVQEETLEPVETTEEAAESYTYKDFKGYYLHFDSNDRSHSDMIITISESYITAGWWMSEFELMEITGRTIEGNVLTLDYYQAADGAYILEDTWGSFQVVLEEDGGEKKIMTESGDFFYFMTEQEVDHYDYTLKDYIINDM